MNLPKCPLCRKRDKVSAEGRVYRCRRCNGLFDLHPEEGGTHSNDPTKRIEREGRKDRSYLKGGL